ncbi:bifunctional riboflavin kinase/FAD synthetase [Microbacterium sp. BK668]|uniref:bifunctional riboflavin kinase/FAD synthetase n=1 Tax=Microbacterium sp. BK668 TaxID=2512118 RepID=UPI00105BBC40|nr:bifunctional riboflavin kinase/FAD synthetase [Microbacterium sp. BK668]TDN88571.1 FMN adenylyltransferase /riboflavin kinase [Microbacterium sp. BK668]
MIVFRDPAEVPAGFGPSVIAIGKFDGVHAGHRAVLERAKVDAASGGAQVVAVTFDRNPLSLLRPEVCPEDLIGVTQKVHLLADTGIDATLVLRFDEALAALSPRDFVERVLVNALGARTVLVGRDFRFGRGGAGNPGVLRELGDELGFRVDVVDDVRSLDSDRRVSSTWIRELLSAGDVETAAKLLGRPHAVWGEVVHGAKRGRELGYPTANLAADLEGFIPADGVYAGWLVDEGPGGPRRSTRYPAAISVGSNPTFDDVTARQVEAYVLDETDLDLYGRRVEVQFTARVRSMVAFQGADALIEQMGDDVTRVRALLS